MKPESVTKWENRRGIQSNYNRCGRQRCIGVAVARRKKKNEPGGTEATTVHSGSRAAH